MLSLEIELSIRNETKFKYIETNITSSYSSSDEHNDGKLL